jgi:hypothetical protein
MPLSSVPTQETQNVSARLGRRQGPDAGERRGVVVERILFGDRLRMSVRAPS